MKKFYLLAGVLLAFTTFTAQAQITVTFEDLELEEESYYEGADYAGEFNSAGVTFSNFFDDEYQFWLGGFAYSNVTDNTTSGYTNMHSSVTGSGVYGSENYAVNNTFGEIQFQEEVDLVSVNLTNTTYAYLSMRDGDDFAKKFGENGDEDYFYIELTFKDGEGNEITTIPFYLADFTSADESEHFILDDWVELDLAGINGVASISFGYFSSDEGEYGINTPTYFALDNLVYLPSTTYPIEADAIVHFEELELEEESYYNGDDYAGGFVSSGVTFSNFFDEDYQFWLGGFAYTNGTDAITPGYENMYSAIAGSGAGNSSNYAINNTFGEIHFDTEVDLVSVDLTNTTYAYLSMRDGDGFAKKFGENGDKDYFYIEMTFNDSEGDEITKLPFLLADFTSDNEEDHYIVKDWTRLNLGGINGVSSISFEYFSSDEGEYGINTPTYFALDNLAFNVPQTSSVTEEEVVNNFKVYPNPSTGNFTIQGNGNYTIYSVSGQKITDIQTAQEKVEYSLSSGIYFVNDNQNGKTLKLIIQ